MLPLLFPTPHLLLQLLLSLLIRGLLLLLPLNLPIPIAFRLGGIQLLISTLIDLYGLEFSLFLLLLHALHALQDFLMIVALAGDALGLLVAGVLAEDLVVLPLFK
jgi:hypothetical protein